MIEESVGPDPEQRLNELGLSTELIHGALRAGASNAANRTRFALKSTRGTVIYHDTMESFGELLAPHGWRDVDIDQQPRFLNAVGNISFTISSAVNVGNWNSRSPRTRRKGPATRKAIAPAPVEPGLFDGDNQFAAQADLIASAHESELWFLLVERAKKSNGLFLEFSRPSAPMTRSGSVRRWTQRIPIDFFDMDGDLSIFDPGSGGAGNEFNVSVEPR